MIEQHRIPGQKLKALAFCRDISHARRMADAMADYYNTRYLTGGNSVGERVRAYKDLQDDNADLEILFTEDCNNQYVSDDDIKRYTIEFYRRYKSWTSLNDSLACFFMEYGPLCSTSSVKKVLKELDKDGFLQLRRTPEYTSSGKRKATFMTEDKNQKVFVKWVQ